MKCNLKVLALMLVALAPASAPLRAQPMSWEQASANIPARYRRAVEFLDLLRKAQRNPDPSKVEVFGEVKRPLRDIPKLLSFVSKRGVTLIDANVQDGKPLFVPRAQLKRDLSRRESRAFEAFAYLGFVAAMPYAQYSQLSQRPTSSGVVISVAGAHELLFVREGGVLKLAKLAYLRLEGH